MHYIILLLKVIIIASDLNHHLEGQILDASLTVILVLLGILLLSVDD